MFPAAVCINFEHDVVPPRGQAGDCYEALHPICSLASQTGDGLLTLFLYTTEKVSVNITFLDWCMLNVGTCCTSSYNNLTK